MVLSSSDFFWRAVFLQAYLKEPDRSTAWQESDNLLILVVVKFDSPLEKVQMRPHLEGMEKDETFSQREGPTLAIPAQAMILREAVMTAYSITGNLSAATTLCSSLVDEDLPGEQQASAVLNQLHHIAMRRPKH